MFYTRKDKSKVWRCTVRGVDDPCPATVEQNGTTYALLKPHTCTPQNDVHLRLKILSDAKIEGLENKFKPALRIVEEVVQNVDIQNPSMDLPVLDQVARSVNRNRAKVRPQNPTALFF